MVAVVTGLVLLGMTTVNAADNAKAKLITGPPSAGVAGPAWVRDLVVYEIATKAFTSPNGPESGTFASLRTKLPYLRWNDKKAFLIAANPGHQSKTFRFKLPLATLGWKCGKVVVNDLWNGKPPVILMATGGTVEIQGDLGADKTPGGGLGIFLCTPAD